MTSKGSLLPSMHIVKAFLTRNFLSPVENSPKICSFGGKLGSKCKILFSGPQKGTSLREMNHLAYRSCKSVQGSRLDEGRTKKNLSESLDTHFRIFGGRKGVIVSWWNFAWGRGPRRNYPCKFRWRSVQVFWGSGGRISHFPIDLRCRP